MWFVDLFREYPSLAIFLTLFLGFWIGKFKYKSFSLGTVTSVLLVGVLVGQMKIDISGPLKSVFFLLFLFAIGYSVGPQFFRGLRKDGMPQVLFAVVMCLMCLGVTWAAAVIMGYNMGEAAGLLSGAQTISAVIGVGGDTIQQLDISQAEKTSMINIIPVCYAVTYIFGTAGSAWILGTLGPKMLGGIDKVKASTKELEAKLGNNMSGMAGFNAAVRQVVFRAYTANNEWFDGTKTVADFEVYMLSMGKRLFVERIRHTNNIVDAVTPAMILYKGDTLVISGRREYVVQEETWIGEEVNDSDLLNFAVETLPIVINKKSVAGKTVQQILGQPFMHGVSIRSIKRASVKIPILGGTTLDAGDSIEIVGLKQDVEAAAVKLGFADRPTQRTSMMLVGLGILLGGIFGALTLHIGNAPLSLSTSGGVLIAGLVAGWARAKRPYLGSIPDSTVWFLNNVGLNMFIAVVGISAGPSFIEGFKTVGWSLFVVGAIATSVPLIAGVLIGKYIFKFNDALNLGCNAGARTTTAALGAVEESLDSQVPALGYTITYAIGNTLLIIWGVVIVLLMQ